MLVKSEKSPRMCGKVSEILAGKLPEALSDDEAAGIMDHIDGCGACRGEFEQTQERLLELMRSSLQSIVEHTRTSLLKVLRRERETAARGGARGVGCSEIRLPESGRLAAGAGAEALQGPSEDARISFVWKRLEGRSQRQLALSTTFVREYSGQVLLLKAGSDVLREFELKVLPGGEELFYEMELSRQEVSKIETAGGFSMDFKKPEGVGGKRRVKKKGR